MDQKQLPDNVEEVPFIYPLVRISFSTNVIVDGKVVDVHGDEVFDIKKAGDAGAQKTFTGMLLGFRRYMKAIQATRLTPDVLQRIRDSQSPAAPQSPTDLPSSSSPALQGEAGTGLPDSPGDAPETASASARTPSGGTTQEE